MEDLRWPSLHWGCLSLPHQPNTSNCSSFHCSSPRRSLVWESVSCQYPSPLSYSCLSTGGYVHSMMTSLYSMYSVKRGVGGRWRIFRIVVRCVGLELCEEGEGQLALGMEGCWPNTTITTVLSAYPWLEIVLVLPLIQVLLVLYLFFAQINLCLSLGWALLCYSLLWELQSVFQSGVSQSVTGLSPPFHILALSRLFSHLGMQSGSRCSRLWSRTDKALALALTPAF